MADLFEDYKEALKRGHVAVLRGELEDAIGHYRAAAEIAPDRPLPHSSLGGVLLRLGRTGEAVAAYEDAVRRGPADETALGGLSDTLLAAGRRAEAAEVLDRLAGVQLEKGRQAEALATRGLARAVRAAGGIPEPGSDERAAAPNQDGIAVAAAGTGAAPSSGADTGDADQLPDRPADVDPPAGDSSPEPESPPAEASTSESPAAEVSDAESQIVDEAPGDAEPEVPQPPRPWELVGEAEQASTEGRHEEAVRAYVLAARQYREISALDAGLDACQEALRLAPGSAEVHLAMAGLYFDSGWGERAAEKLVLLDRLLQLEEPNGWQEQLAALARQHASEDGRLESLSARGAHQTPPSGD